MGPLYHICSFQGLGIIMEEGVKRLSEPEATVFCGLDKQLHT